jgi:hypothetical protein
VRLGEFGEFVFRQVARAAAEDALVLLVQVLGHGVLVARLLGLHLLGQFRQAVLLVAGGGQAFGGFGQVLVVLGFVGAGLGGEQQAAGSADGAVAVGAQFETFTTGRRRSVWGG